MNELMKLYDELFSESFYNTGLSYNLYKDEDNLKLEVNLPGFKKENISVTFKNKILNISAKREKVKDSNLVMIWNGFKTQDINKSIEFISEFKEVSAKYFNGVLIIDMIKDKEQEGIQVEIK